MSIGTSYKILIHKTSRVTVPCKVTSAGTDSSKVSKELVNYFNFQDAHIKHLPGSTY